MRFYSWFSTFVFGLFLSFGANAQTPQLYWEAINEGGKYADPYEACYQSHQSWVVNDGITPNSFGIDNGTSAWCKWDRGGPGYWGTTGHAVLRCPSGYTVSETGDGCSLKITPAEEGLDDSCEQSHPTTPNPIDILSGNKYWSEKDFSVGRGRLHFTRYYSLKAFHRPSSLGRNWASNLHPRIYGKWVWWTGRFYFTEPSGKVIRYHRDAGGWKKPGAPWGGCCWFAREGHDRKDQPGYELTEVSSTQLTLKSPDGTERDFEVSAADSDDLIMTKIRYPDGYEITLNYNASRILSSATDTDGYTIDFAYNTQGLLDKVTAPDGTEYRYEYASLPNSGWLSSLTPNGQNVWQFFRIMSKVIYPDDTPSNNTDNPTKQYNYDHVDTHTALTSLVDERGITRHTWDYAWSDSGWRAISSVGPNSTENWQVDQTVYREKITVTNPLGKQAIYNFADRGKILKLTSVEGQASAGCAASNKSISYDGNGHITGTTSEEGQLVSKSVNGTTGLPNSITYGSGSPDAETHTYTWDATLRKPTQVERTGLRSEFTYDADWNVTEAKFTDTTSHTSPYSTNGVTRIWAYTWNTEGLLASIDGPVAGVGDTTSFTYDTNGNLASVTDVNGHVTTINSVDGMGRPTQITDPNGVVSSITYSPRGWVEQVSQSVGASTRTTDMTYDNSGNLTRLDLPTGGWITYTYNDNGWMTQASASTGETLTYAHNAMGSVTSLNMSGSGGSPASFTMQYDELGRLTQLLGGAGDVRNFGYDRSNRQTSMVDGLGRSWLTGFNALDRVISDTDPETHVIQYDWGPSGDLETYTDGRSLATQFTRTGFGEVIREVSPDRGTTDYWYDNAGRMTRMLDAEGDDVTYTYDDAGRLLTETYPNQAALNVTYTYDSVAGGNQGKGRLTGVSGGASGHTFHYNSFGELTSQVSTVGSQTYAQSQTYNGSGQMTGLTLPSGRTVTFTLDALSRVTSVSTAASGGGTSSTVVSNVTYAPYGPITGYTFGNNATATFTLDASHRLSALSVAATGPSLLNKTYTYDNNNRVTWITDNLNSANTASYVYTPDGRLENAVGPWGDYSWTYDAVGNRLTDTHYNGGTLTLDDDYTYGSSSNRLLSVSDGGGGVNRMISYTADGNINTDIRTSGPSRDYDYDDDGRLAQVSVSGSVIATYDYDAFEQRVRRTEGGVQTHFVFSPSGQLIGEYDGATGAVKAEYIWLNNRLVGTVDNAGTLSFVQTGHLGQPLLVMDGTGAAIWQGETTPFGVFVATSGSASDPGLRFPGQWLEAGSGLYQNWHRDYDPSLGRYIEADPLGIAAGQSIYSYTSQDPLNWIDFDGLQQLRFNGYSLAYEDPNGAVTRVWPAVSGSPRTCQCQADMQLPNLGPIPDGNYTVDPSETNYRRWYKRDWGSESAWGNVRTPIRPKPGTNTFGRRGMYIHGGFYRGSAGCIDLTNQNDDFHDWLSDQSGPLDLVVNNMDRRPTINDFMDVVTQGNGN